MFIKIPFESEIEFKSNISEITKMSLEHDFNINDDVVLGNFYISGEYRSHEVSVNTESFNYTLPFSVDYRSDLRKDTLEFNVEDFSYDIKDGNKLKVNIEYSIKGEVDELFEKIDETILDSELSYIDDFIEENILDEDLEETEINVESKEKEEIKEELEEVRELDKDRIEEEIIIKEEEKIDMKEKEMIIDTIKNKDDTFVTYHIHIVKESETIDSICSLYGVQNSLINEYNEIDNISIGDKILIPKIDE